MFKKIKYFGILASHFVKQHRKVTPSRLVFELSATCAGGGDSLASALEPPAIVAGLNNLTVLRHPVQERRGHLGVSEDLRPFA